MKMVLSSSPSSSSAATSRPTFWSMLSTMAAYTSMYRAKSSCSRSLSSSHGRTSWSASVLRGASGVPSGITPSSSWRRYRSARRASQPASVAAPVPRHVVGLGVERGVHGAVGEVEEEGLVGVRRLALAHHRHGPVGEVVGEVVAVGVVVDLDLVVVLDQAVGVVQVGEGVEEAVEAVEAPLAGPRVLGPGVRAVGVLGQVPLADHQGRVAVVAQDLGQGGDVVGQLHGVAGEAGVEVGDRAEAGPVGVEAGEQRRAGGRAHRRDVEVGVPHPAGGQRVEVGRGDLRAVAAEVGEAEVVGQHDHDVGGARRRRRPRRPPALRTGEGAAQLPLESRWRSVLVGHGPSLRCSIASSPEAMIGSPRVAGTSSPLHATVRRPPT